DDLDGAVDTGAEAARIGEQDFHGEIITAAARRRAAQWKSGSQRPCVPAADGVLLRGRNASQARMIAPPGIAEAAAVKAGQGRPAAWKAANSTAAPNRMRSITFPTAPASTSDRARANRRCRGCLCSRYTIPTTAASAIAMNSPRCQPDWSERK